MAPTAIDPVIVDVVQPKKDTLNLPPESRKRLENSGVDLSNGYPYRPAKPLYVQDVQKIRDYHREHVDPGARADPAKRALFSAAEKVIDLTAHIGTEIVGLQLKDLTDQQKDELGLLIAERSVVFFRDQDISPQQQKDLGEWYGEIEVHVGIPLPCPQDLETDNFQASSTPGPRCRGCECHLARAASNRSQSRFSKPRRRFSLAFRFGPRAPAGRGHSSPQ